jgi:hypothetical protein
VDKDKRKNHLRLVKPENTKRLIIKPTPEEEMDVDIQGRLESTVWQILTGSPDYPVVIDERAPLEVKLRVLAAVKSYTLGIKSVDYVLERHAEKWEEQLSGEE